MEPIDSTTVSSDDISVDRCRALLGDEADVLSDAEIELIKRHAETLARVVIDVFLTDHATVH